MSTGSTRDAMQVAEQAARAGMEVIQSALAAVASDVTSPGREVQHKGDVDLVTQTDLAAEAAVCAVLERLLRDAWDGHCPG